jgi:hypothetical protein
MRDQSSIVVLGDSDLQQFAAPLHWLKQRKSLQHFHTVAEAERFLATNACAGQVITVARPGRFTTGEIETLHALAPMAPVVALVGAWCDGETRSGKPWPGVPRVAWHAWRSAFSQLWGDKPQKRSLWLPRLATDLDRLIAQPALPCCPSGHLLFVRSSDHRLAEILVMAAEQQGWRAIHVHEEQLATQDAAEAWIWDWSPSAADEALRLRAARVAHPQARVVALLDFARPEAAALAETNGANAVLGKPFSLADLFEALAATSESLALTAKTAA